MKHAEYEQAITERLVEYAYVEAPLVDRARAFQKTRQMTLLRALVELKLVSVDAVNRVVEEVTGTSTVDPSLLTVYPEYIETVSKLIPKELVTQALVFPVQSELNTIHVSMLNPTDRELISSLEALSGCHRVATNGLPAASIDSDAARKLVEALVQKRLGAPMDSYADPAVALVNRNRDKLGEPATLEAVVRHPDIIRFVHQILVRLVNARASDIHFEPLESGFRIRSRIDGGMRTVWTFAPALSLATSARLKVMAGTRHEREPRAAGLPHQLRPHLGAGSGLPLLEPSLDPRREDRPEERWTDHASARA